MNLLAEIHWAEAGVGLLLGGVLGTMLWRLSALLGRRATEQQCQARVESSRREAEAIVREARLAASEEAVRLRRETEEKFLAQKRGIEEEQSRLAQREKLINEQLTGLVERERQFRDQLTALDQQRMMVAGAQREAAALVQQQREQLQELSHLSEPEARALLLKRVEQETLKDAADLSRRRMDEARSTAESQARRIIGIAIQRFAGEHTFETTTATVALNGDDIKGRIIGR